MKIEKLNDNQIRCTLTPADLEERQLKLSELAYGTEKAKSLFNKLSLSAFMKLSDNTFILLYKLLYSYTLKLLNC